MSYVAENISRIESEITELVTDLYVAFSSNPGEGQLTDAHALDIYIKRVARIGLCAGKEGLVSLQDVCLIYKQILGNVRKQSNVLTDHVRERLEVWPMLAMGLLTSPIDDELYADIVEFFEDPVWPQSLSYEDVIFLRNDTKSKKIPAEESTTSTNGKNDTVYGVIYEDDYQDSSYSADYLTIPYDNMTLEALQEEVLEMMADLLVELNSHTEGQLILEYADSLNLCADRSELVGITVATMGFMGLMDVCQYFQYSLRELATSEESVDEKVQEILEEWPAIVIAYLTAPEDHDNSQALVDYIKNIPWTPELLEEEAGTFYEQLLADGVHSKGGQNAPGYNEETMVDDQHVTTMEQLAEAESSNIASKFYPDSEDNIAVGKIEEQATEYGAYNELIEIVKIEIEANISELYDSISQLANSSVSQDCREEAAKNYQSLVERFRLASESIGLNGLSNILNNISKNIEYWLVEESGLTVDQYTFMKMWPSSVIDYLDDFQSAANCNRLAEGIINADLPVKSISSASELSNELRNPVLIVEEDIEQRATKAHTDDVSLELPEDVNQQLLDTLLHELPSQTAEFTHAISRLVDGEATLQIVEVAQRIAHTLKGSANTVGVKGIATLTHHIEDILTAFVKHERLPGTALADVLMNAADVLEAMSETLLGIGPAPEQARSVLQDVLDWANRIDQLGIAEIDDTTVPTRKSDDEALSEIVENTNQNNESSMQTMLRVPAELMDELLRLVGESLILSGQLHERVQQLREQTQLEQAQNKLFQQLCIELEQITDIKGIVARESNGTYDEVFDTLELDQYNELHTITHRLVEASTDARELTHGIEDGLNALDGLLIEQSRQQKETQEVVMRTRMVSVQNIVPRLQRVLRQTCRFTGKQAVLDVKGSDTMIDSDVLDDLIDPLMHIIRNAIDHGIDQPDVRVEKGKDAKGQIELRFSRVGDHINVECSDDGVGLDYEAIKDAAVHKGLISNNKEITDEELRRLVWLPGFTTKEQTTQISGRGIGMDAVYNRVSAMKGTLNINSSQEGGTTIEMRLPLTMISIHALLVTAYNQVLAISSRGIEQILPHGDGYITHEDDKPIFHIGEDAYEVADLESMLHLPFNRDNTDRTVLLVRDETGNMHAISLDKVLASKDLVVKQLGSFLPEIAGIEGSTILGDGSVAPVIDLPSLFRSSSTHTISPWIEQLEETGIRTDAPQALIVDDSLSARRSLAEYVKDLGFEVLTAKDGLEAIEVIESCCPDILLIDFEMPRMNGVELTSHIRADNKTRNIPIIMITSRATEKHQSMATSAGVDIYLTKPFSEDVLMEHINDLYHKHRQ